MLDVRWYGHSSILENDYLNARWQDGKITGSPIVIIMIKKYSQNWEKENAETTSPDYVGYTGIEAIQQNPKIFIQTLRDIPTFFTDKIEWVPTYQKTDGIIDELGENSFLMSNGNKSDFYKNVRNRI